MCKLNSPQMVVPPRLMGSLRGEEPADVAATTTIIGRPEPKRLPVKHDTKREIEIDE